jgi:hypothetical protein
VSDKQVFRLVHPAARQLASKAVINAPDGYVCEIKPRTRSLDQNAKFHAMCTDVARQAKHMGRSLTPLQWKCLFVSGHAVATEAGTDIVPGLEGEFVNIRESTANMGVKRKASLIEYVQAWGDENGVKWSEPAPQGYDEIRGAA